MRQYLVQQLTATFTVYKFAEREVLRDLTEHLQGSDFCYNLGGRYLLQQIWYNVLVHGWRREHALCEQRLELLWSDLMSVVLRWLEIDREVARNLIEEGFL